MYSNHSEIIKKVTGDLALIDESKYKYFKEDSPILPSVESIVGMVCAIRHIMFPKYYPDRNLSSKSDTEKTNAVFCMLSEQIERAYSKSECPPDTAALAYDILSTVPKIKEALIKDAEAIYEGDPAATSAEEVVLSYPGFLAISVYRIAHEFYKRKIPYISRMITEYAHERTGVDIHAGATIGEYFFIDHGTGIVIGETTTIGDRVKIYQGVTLGAKCFELDEDGNPIKGVKRHPDICDDTVIYANATILGGNTRVGKGSIIGANVWITESVPDGSKVFYTKGK